MDTHTKGKDFVRKRGLTFPINYLSASNLEKEIADALLKSIKESLSLSDKAIKDFRQLIDCQCSNRTDIEKSSIPHDASLQQTMRAFFKVRGIDPEQIPEEKLSESIKKYVDLKLEIEQKHRPRQIDPYFCPTILSDSFKDSFENEIDEEMKSRTQGNSFNAEIGSPFRINEEKFSLELSDQEETFVDLDKNSLISVLRTQKSCKEHDVQNLIISHEKDLKSKEKEIISLKNRIEKYEQDFAEGRLVYISNLHAEIKINEKNWSEKFLNQEMELNRSKKKFEMLKEDFDKASHLYLAKDGNFVKFAEENVKLKKIIGEYEEAGFFGALKLKECEIRDLKKQIELLENDKSRYMRQASYLVKENEEINDSLRRTVKAFELRDELRVEAVNKIVKKYSDSQVRASHDLARLEEIPLVTTCASDLMPLNL